MMAVGAITAILSPVGLVVAAVVALGAAWATNFLGIRDITKSVFDFIKSVFDKLVNFISDSFERLKKVIDYIKKAVAGIGKVAVEGITVGVETKEGFGVGGTSIPSHAAGIRYVPETGLALIHKGEGVLNPEENKAYQSGSKGGISVIIDKIIVGDNVDKVKMKVMATEAFEEAAREYSRNGNYLVPGMA